MSLEREVQAIQDLIDMLQDDPINPPHYRAGGVECIDYLKAKMTPEQFEGFCLGNALKYLSRLGKKDDSKQDAAKAAWYCAWLAGKDPRNG